MPAPTAEQRRYYRSRPNKRSPAMYQQWRDLLFLHWEISPEVIQATLPEGLYVDTFEERAYLAIVPFFMQGIRPRYLPAVPGVSNFLEINLRTYVYDKSGRPGVWFYSLDANQWIAVQIARKFFHLPYHFARMSAHRDHEAVDFTISRVGCAQEESSRFHYKAKKRLIASEENSLEFFLVERYLLFAESSGRLYSGQVHHAPYELSTVEVSILDTRLAKLSGFKLSSTSPDHLVYSPGVDVEVFAIEQISI